MKELIVTPHVGIGPLKLGMSPEQIMAAINQVIDEFAIPNDEKISILPYQGRDRLSVKYINKYFLFIVQYQNNQAIDIAVGYMLREYAIVTLYDIDVFKTSAEKLVGLLKPFGQCTYDLDDEQLSTEYIFSDINVRLWREYPFHEKLLSDEKYMKSMGLVIDDMYQYLYFEIIAVTV